MKMMMILIYSLFTLNLMASDIESTFLDIDSTFIDEEPCEGFLTKFAKDVSYPNCLSRQKLFMAQKGKLTPLCQVCKKDFLSKVPSDQKKSSSHDSIKLTKQKIFLDITFQEYKKVLTNALVDIMKLRALRPTGSHFKESIQKCEFKSANDFKGCSESTKKILEKSLSGLQNELAGELSQLISTVEPTDRSTGVLDRGATKNICFIPERDLLYLQNVSLEETFTPELLNAILTINPNDFKSTDEILDSLSNKNIPNISEIRGAFSSHPLLSIYMNNPRGFFDFVQKLNPKNSSGLKARLYSLENGDSFDKELASVCSKAFETFSQSICSNEFAEGNIAINPFAKDKFFEDDLAVINSELANSEESFQKNLKVFQYCDMAQSKGKMEIEEKLNLLNSHLSGDLAELPLKKYNQKKYEQDISRLNESICNIESGKQACIEGTLNCSIYKRYKELNNKDSLDSKLAQSSNSEINSLLRAFIGSPKNLTAETKNILIAQGIIPKDDGTMVAQKQIPERAPDYYSKNAAPTSGPATPMAQAAIRSKTSPGDSHSQSMYSSEKYAQTASFRPDSVLPDNSEFMKDSSNLQDIEQEIMRRLSGLPNKRPTSKDQARAIAREAYKSHGKALSPAREEAIASRMMAAASPQQFASADTDFFDENAPLKNEAGVSSTETAAEKFKKDGMNRALADMAGARAAGAGTGSNDRTPASVKAEEANLTTVALNINDDPKVSLSQLFGEKFNKNDPETQLLKVLVNNKKNFLLQIRGVNFKVIFDDKNNMSLLLDSGDKEEAQRLRPQLEIFFKRLRKNI